MEFSGPARPAPEPDAFGWTLGVPGPLAPLLYPAAKELGIEVGGVVQNYYLHKLLFAVTQAFPTTATMLAWESNRFVPVKGWAFAGGTALASGLDVVDRYSEDLDLVAYTAGLGTNAAPRLCRTVCDVAARGLTAVDAAVRLQRGGGQHVKQAVLWVPHHLDPVKVDVTPTHDDPALRTVGTARSLLGRYASAELLEAHPELRPAGVPLLNAEITAANKLDALHRRAVHNDLAGLTWRARDLYDLAAIARSEPLATRVKAHIRARFGGGAVAAEVVTRRSAAQRPAAGYAASPAFTPGAAAYEAIRLGYEGTPLRGLLFATSPTVPFAEAIELACQLDPITENG